MKAVTIFLTCLAAITLLVSCPSRYKFTVMYDGNNNTGGEVPVDENRYRQDEPITVLENSGGLVRDAYTFTGWNRAAEGTGENYRAGDTFPMGTEDVTLYADWEVNPVATTGVVSRYQKISSKTGGLTGSFETGEEFGSGICSPGDLNGDGIEDLVVGSWSKGIVRVLFMNPDGTVASHQKIDENNGGFSGSISGSFFGYAVETIGDLNEDGVPDIAVGAPGDDDGADQRGAVWILFLNSDGTVQGSQKISDTEGGFTGVLDASYPMGFGTISNRFGTSLAAPGDLDGDGVPDLVVGGPYDDDGGDLRGAVWVLFLNADGTVASHQKISDTEGGFGGELHDSDKLGSSLTCPGDMDGDGIPDLAVGEPEGDDDGGPWRGAIWVLIMNRNGTVAFEQKICDGTGGFTGTLADSERFGSSLASPGDLNLDGVPDLVVGADLDVHDGKDTGAVWVLFMNSDGTVDSFQEISASAGGFQGVTSDGDLFGEAVGVTDDMNEDGIPEIIVGAPKDDEGGDFSGAVYVLFLEEES